MRRDNHGRPALYRLTSTPERERPLLWRCVLVSSFVADGRVIYSCEGTREMNTLIVGRKITGLSAFA